MMFHKKINLKSIFILALLTIAQNILPIITEDYEDLIFCREIREYQKNFSKLRIEYHLSNNKKQSDTFKEFVKRLVACCNNSISSSYCRENENDIVDRFFTHPSEKECAIYERMQELQNLRVQFHKTRDLAIKKDLLHRFNALLSTSSNLFDKEISKEKIRAIFLDSRCLKTFQDHITELSDI